MVSTLYKPKLNLVDCVKPVLAKRDKKLIKRLGNTMRKKKEGEEKKEDHAEEKKDDHLDTSLEKVS